MSLLKSEAHQHSYLKQEKKINKYSFLFFFFKLFQRTFNYQKIEEVAI